MKIVTLILLFSAASTVADYRAKSNDEIEILAAMLKSEVSANNWTDNDLISFRIGSRDPSKHVVEALRSHRLNVCSEAEWRRRLACEYSIWIAPVIFGSAKDARVRFQSSDLRERSTAVKYIS